ncbi:MAG: helix-turn-helix domain-containing protein, partial [Prevotella sp.]|nr:helix-turn-helix domain-containing protein [Prevotella sp.]
NNKQAMARLDNVMAELMLTVRAKTLLLQCIEKEGFSITTYLKQKQMTLLETMERFSGGATPKRRTTERKNKAPKEKTENVSLKLFLNGMTPAQVAKERGLAIDTVISHLMKFIPQKVVKIDDLVSPEHQAAIKRVINIVGTGDGSAPIKALCPPEVTYQEIRIMLQQLK